MVDLTPKRGAIPTPRHALAAAMPYTTPHTLIGAPPNFITIPAQLSEWGNVSHPGHPGHGDCVTAEEAFAKACNNPEIFISEADVIAWATRHGVLEGANLLEVLQWMQTDGFKQGITNYCDGSHVSVDWTNSGTLRSAISNGPVKIGVGGNQLETAWDSTGGGSGWFGTGFHGNDPEDHCVSLCGYGSISWLAQQLHVAVPAGIDGTKNGYALFTWGSIGIIDEPSLVAITHEAWLRQPTTVPRNMFPDWALLDNNPASIGIIADGNDLYQLHNTGRIWKYTGTPLTGWQELDNNPRTKQIVAAGGHLYQIHKTGLIWKYVGPPMSGWQLLDNNPASVGIIADGNDLYQLHNTGLIWKYTGTPLTGWQALDNNPATKKIIAAGGHLYQIHKTGLIWKYVGPPMTGWQLLDNNHASVDIIAEGNNLYQLHNTGLIWKYTGTPLTGWQALDNNPATKKIVAAGGNLYQLHNTGRIWKYTGPPMTGWQLLDGNAASVDIVAGGTHLYQIHNDGLIWRYTK